MDTLSLTANLKKIKRESKCIGIGNMYIRVCSSDKLYQSNPRANDNIALIINEDSVLGRGTLWVAIWSPKPEKHKGPRTCYFFDPYGRAPLNETILNFMKRLGISIIWREKRVLPRDCDGSGQFCSSFLYWMVNQKGTVDEFYAKFENTTEKYMRGRDLYRNLFKKKYPDEIVQTSLSFFECQRLKLIKK